MDDDRQRIQDEIRKSSQANALGGNLYDFVEKYSKFNKKREEVDNINNWPEYVNYVERNRIRKHLQEIAELDLLISEMDYEDELDAIYKKDMEKKIEELREMIDFHRFTKYIIEHDFMEIDACSLEYQRTLADNLIINQASDKLSNDLRKQQLLPSAYPLQWIFAVVIFKLMFWGPIWIASVFFLYINFEPAINELMR